MPVSLNTTLLLHYIPLLSLPEVSKRLVSVGELWLERVNSGWILQQCEIEPSLWLGVSGDQMYLLSIILILSTTRMLHFVHPGVIFEIAC